MLGLDLHLFELAQGAEPHVEDRLGLHIGELEALHQHGLRLVLASDDADHLVEVEIGDQEAFQDFQPMVDLLQPVLGTAAQHDFAVVQPLPQHLHQPHHLRDLPLGQHRHVERDARFQLGEAEKLLHQQRRIDVARLRLDDDADVLGGFVVHVAQQRQLLGLQQVGHLLDQPRFLHAIGDLGDDNLIGAAPRFLGMPARAQAERAAPGLVGLDQRGLIVDEYRRRSGNPAPAGRRAASRRSRAGS